MNILILEDDPILASLTAETLEDHGHSIVGPAYTPAEALHLVTVFPVDVAFVDINLNGRDEGIGVAQTLRENHQIQSLFLSGQFIEANTQGCEAIGLLTKPYSIEALVNSASITQSWLNGEVSDIRVPRGLDIFHNPSNACPRKFSI
jgi:CheY-like chemotaxis protein